MPSLQAEKRFLKALAGAVLVMLSALPPVVAASQPSLNQEAVDQAISYFGLLSGRAIATKDGDWLRAAWQEQFEHTPDAIAARLDELALGLELYQRDQDPILLARERLMVVEEAYCVAEQTSDPDAKRLRAIIAPDDLVLAADCLFGFVVTDFDVDGLVASHALTAEATGQAYEPERNRAELVGYIEREFAGAAPSEKALMANGEVRSAILTRFWSRIDGKPEQAEVVEAVRGEASSDLPAVARKLEELALTKLGQVDYIARNDEYRLTTGMVDTNQTWLERIAGSAFSRRERAWLEDALARELDVDPGKLIENTRAIERLNRDYVLSEDDAERSVMLAGWASHVHCLAKGSSDPDERRLGEIVFRHDPVIEADCAAGTVVRRRDQVLAGVGDRQLSERDLEGVLRFMPMLLGRPLSADEAASIREDEIRTFEENPDEWQKEDAEVRKLLSEVEKYDDSLFLGADNRQKYFDQIYCYLKASDDPSSSMYVAMFQKNGAITFEDCERQLVTTKDEIEAFLDVTNFLRAMNGERTLDADQTVEARQTLASLDLTKAESWRAALSEWWGLLSLDERAENIAKVRREGITMAAEDDRVAQFINMAKLEIVTSNAMRDQCEMAAIIAQGQTAIFAAQAGRYGHDDTIDARGFVGAKLSWLLPYINSAASFCS